MASHRSTLIDHSRLNTLPRRHLNWFIYKAVTPLRRSGSEP
jgi:hypothetical protein